MDEDRPSVRSGPPVGSRANERSWLAPQPREVNRFGGGATLRSRVDRPTLDVDEEASSDRVSRKEDSAASLLENFAAMRSETLLEYEEEIAPMMTSTSANRCRKRHIRRCR